MTSHQQPVRDDAPPQVRVAGGIVGLQGLVGLVFAVVIGVGAAQSQLGLQAVLAETGYFAILGVALVAVGGGLVTSHRWARTPAIVMQLLLLPVVYSLIGPSQQLLLGIGCGIVVFAAFMLLISEPSRVWSMGLPANPAP